MENLKEQPATYFQDKWMYCINAFYYPDADGDNKLDLIMEDDRHFLLEKVGIGLAKCVGIESDHLILDNMRFRIRVKPAAIHRIVPAGDPKFRLNDAVREKARPDVRGIIRGYEWHDKDAEFNYYIRIGTRNKSRRYSEHELEGISFQ